MSNALASGSKLATLLRAVLQMLYTFRIVMLKVLRSYDSSLLTYPTSIVFVLGITKTYLRLRNSIASSRVAKWIVLDGETHFLTGTVHSSALLFRCNSQKFAMNLAKLQVFTSHAPVSKR